MLSEISSRSVRQALLGVAALAVCAFSSANAQTNLNKKFVTSTGAQITSTSPANPGQVIKLRFSIFNENAVPITNVSFADYFNATGTLGSSALTGIQLNQEPPVFNVVPGTACVGANGTGTATPTVSGVSPGVPASTRTGVNVSGFGVAAPVGGASNAECQIEVEVVAISGGNKVNTIPPNRLSVNGSTTNSSSAISETFFVRTIADPIVTKGFGGGAGTTNSLTANVGTTQLLNVRIRNSEPAGGQSLNDVQVFDRLPTAPAGLQYVTTPAASFSAGCQGTPAPTVTYSDGTSGTGNVAQLNIARIPANTNCDVTLRVAGPAGGVYPNTIVTADITTRENVTDQSGSNTPSLTYQSLTTAKNFSPNIVDRVSTTDPSTNITRLTVTLNNLGSAPITNAEFSDFFTNGGNSTDTDLNLRIAPTPNLAFNPTSCNVAGTTTDTGLTLGASPTTTALANAPAFRISGITIPSNGNCQISVDVKGNASITTGTKTNTLRQQAVLVNGVQATFTNATATLEITPSGVTGRVIGAEKDATNFELVTQANQNSQSWNDSTVILNSATGTTVPSSQRFAWFRIRLWVDPAVVTAPLTNVSFNDDLPNELDYDSLSFGANCGANSGAGLTSTGGDDRLVVAGLTLDPTGANAATFSDPCVILVRANSSQVGGPYVNTINRFGINSDQGASNGTGIDARVAVQDALGVSKIFSPATIGAGGRSRLTITFFNRDTTRSMQQLTFTDTLPAGMTVAAVPETSSTCSNGTSNVLPTLTASNASFAASDNVLLSQASRTATTITATTCSVSFYVQTTNADTPLLNTISAGGVIARPVGGNVSNAADAPATLTRTGALLTIGKLFNPSSIDPNQPSTVTVTLTNPSNGPELTNLSFTDNFTTRVEAGTNFFKIASPVTASTTCNGTSTSANPPAGVTFTGVLKNAAGGTLSAGDTSIRLENGFLAPNSSCTITFVVTSSVAGNEINTILASSGPTSNINSDQGHQNNAEVKTTLSVFSTLAVTKSFNPATVLPGSQTSDLTIQIFSSRTSTVNNLAFTDFFTSDGTSGGASTGIVIAPTPVTVSNTCGGTVSQIAGDNKLSLSGGTLLSGTACSITVQVVANKVPTGSANNTFVNTIPALAVTGTDGAGAVSNRRPATATLTTPPPPTISKGFNPTNILPGQVSNLTITLTNPTGSAATLTAPLVDTLPTGFVVSGAASSNCTSPTINVTPPATTPGVITASALTIPANGSCTIIVPVTNDSTNNFGTRDNVIPKDGLQTSIGNNPAEARVPITLERPLVGYKSVRLTTDADNSQTITTGDTVTWTVFYKNTSTVTINGVQITDVLPTGVTRSGAPAMTTTIGTVNASYNGTGNNNLLGAGVTLTAGQVIRVDIPVIVTVSSGNQDNRAEAAYIGQPLSFPNTQSDTADATTTGLPAGVTIPTGAGIFAAVSQTQTSATNDFTRIVPVATPQAQGWKFVARTNDVDGNGQNTIGDQLTWSVFYKNTGTVTIGNAQITDALPTGLTLVSTTVRVNGTVNTVNDNGGYTGIGSNNLLTGTLNLVAGDVVNVDILTTINSSVPLSGQLDNTATLTAANLPTPGIRTDAGDTTTALPTGITAPTGSQSQAVNQTPGLDATRAIVSPVVSGKVYVDVNNNGAFDAGEPVIPGATVTVTPSSGPAFTLTTNSSGDYSTAVPVGSNVAIVETQPLAYGNGTPNTINLANVPATGSSNNNFGELTGSLSGRVFLDALNNATFEAPDSGIANQCIRLTGTDYGLDGVLGGTGVNADSSVTFSTRTNASGDYSFARNAANTVFASADCSATAILSFAGLRRGDYTITQANQPASTLNGITTAGAVTTGGTAGTATAVTTTPSAISSLILGAGQTSSSNNFAEIAPSSLRGKVFETFDNDAVQDPLETNNLGGTVVTLTYTDDLGRTIVQTATTASGAVAAGAYTNTISVNGAPATTVTLTGAPALTAGQYYFGNVRPTQTGTTYTVTETQPSGFSSNPSNTAAGSAGGTAANNVVSAIPSLAPGTNATGYDFAEYLPVTVQGIVFAERGVAGSNYQAVTDVPIQGATVSLRDSSSNVIPSVPDQTTGATGAYSFTNLPPGGYQVWEPTQPAGTTNQDTYPGTVSGGQTTGSSGGAKFETPSRVTGIIAQSGNTFSNVNFGETFVAGISGVVYRDLNDDGQVGGTGETGIAGIRVELRDSTDAIVVIGGVPQVAATDASGAYSFNNLPAGTYSVVELGRFATSGENQAPGFFDGKATPGTNLPNGNGTAPVGQQGTPPTRINTITLGTTAATNTSTNNNFGEIPKSSLSGKVFETFNNDAIQQAGETNNLGGTTVTLSYTDVNGRTVVQTTATASGNVAAGATTNTISVNGGAATTTTCSSAPALTSGQYYFCDILPLQTGTTYTVTQTQPSGFSSNPANAAAGTSGGNTTVDNVVSGISFAPGTNATGYDFAEYQPVTIQGVVFAERNGTPNFQAGDDPIAGVTVSLRDSSGNVISGVPDQTTSPTGAYSFTNLPPGTYQVVEPTQPAGTINDATFGGVVTGSQLSGSNGGTPTALATTPSAVTGIVAQSGNTISGVNFGEKYNGQISGVVYEDTNDNGVQNALELPISGVRVELTGTDASGNAVTRVPVATLADGSYVFDQLPPGTYTITQKGRDSNPSENQLPNYGDGKATPGTTGAVTNGTPSAQGTRPSTISGIVLGNTPATNNSSANNFGELTADLELTKTVDNAAPSIGGTVKFNLTVTNKGLATATGVRVQDVLPAGFTFVSSNPAAGVTVAGQTVDWVAATIASGATATLEISATVNANQSAAAYVNAAQITGSDIKDPDSIPNNGTTNTEDDRASVTVTPRGNINGTVFKDENGNGVRDAGEAPIPNVSVVITPSGGGTPFTVVTDASGVYDTSTLTAPGVPAGTYSVAIDESTLPADYRNQSAGTNPTSVTVGIGENKKEEDNGYRPTGTVAGSVFADTNGNGVRDAGEPGIVGAPVTVSRPNVPGTTPFAPVTVVTDANGNYTVPGVPTGGAVVTVADTDPALNGFTRVPNDTTVNPGGNNPTPITVVNGNNSAGDDPFRNEGSVKERVFQDTNGNGVQDPGEPGLPGVTVRVTDSGGKVQTGVTDANGDVTIPGVLAGTATVTVVESTLPAGVTAQTAGVNPSTVQVTSGQTADAGFDGYQPRGVLTGLVWRDDNGDGIKDPSEIVLPGVTVTITDQFGKVTVVKTDANGQYSAIVASGPVTVVYTAPDNTRLTTNNDNQTVTVPTGGSVRAVDVGYQPLTGGLTGTVFNDSNANGLKDAGEVGIPGATVTITDAKGKVITLVTDANGNYSSGAADLAFGPATVVVTPPPGYVVTTNNLTQTVNVPAGSIGRVPDVGLVRPSIVLEKNVVQAGVVIPRTQTPTVNLGGNLEYQISVTNSGPIAVRGVSITDTLPMGLQYLPGTSKLEAAALADPVVSVVAGKQVLTWSFPANQVLAPGAVSRIRFITVVTPETRGDQLVNTAVATATTGPTGSTIVVASNASTAAVKVELGVFTNRSVIVGRVYFDVNDNDSFEVDSDQPLPGARVYLSDGRSAVTDSLGRYSIPDIEPGIYTVRLDPVTAPYTVKSTPDMQGAPGSRYVKAANEGGITNEDFPLVRPSAVGVKSRSTVVRRGAVTLTKAITQGGAGYAVTITITVNTAVRNLSITDPLPANSERGPIIGATLEGNVLRLAGITQPGTYTVTYALFTAAPPDLVLTDPDINYEQIFTLIPSSPVGATAVNSDEVIR